MWEGRRLNGLYFANVAARHDGFKILWAKNKEKKNNNKKNGNRKKDTFSDSM